MISNINYNKFKTLVEKKDKKDERKEETRKTKKTT